MDTGDTVELGIGATKEDLVQSYAEKFKLESVWLACKVCGKLKVRRKPKGKSQPELCPSCRKTVLAANANKARQAQLTNSGSIGKKESRSKRYGISPDGSYEICFRNQDEKNFYEQRKNTYLSDFTYKSSSDLSLLTRLLSLELQAYRIDLELENTDLSGPRSDTLVAITQQIGKLQESLGITRKQIIDKKETRTAVDIVQEIVDKFWEYKEKNKERFVWKCAKCGEKNILNKENPNFLIQENTVNQETFPKTEQSDDIGDKLSPVQNQTENGIIVSKIEEPKV